MATPGTTTVQIRADIAARLMKHAEDAKRANSIPRNVTYTRVIEAGLRALKNGGKPK